MARKKDFRKTDKKMNSYIKSVNRELEKHPFNGRFFFHQVSKNALQNGGSPREIRVFMYDLVDSLHPENTQRKVYGVFRSSPVSLYNAQYHASVDMNNFIVVDSDFWDLHANEDHYYDPKAEV